MEDTTNELIGYRFKKGFEKYLDSYAQIVNIKTPHATLDEKRQFTPNSVACTLIEEAGVLAIWFEPVYKNEFNVGDWVYVIDCQIGAHGALNKVGQITNKNATNGLSDDYPDGVRIEFKPTNIWTIGEDYSKIKLRKATEDEIIKAKYVVGDYYTQYTNKDGNNEPNLYKTGFTGKLKSIQKSVTYSTPWLVFEESGNGDGCSAINFRRATPTEIEENTIVTSPFGEKSVRVYSDKIEVGQYTIKEFEVNSLYNQLTHIPNVLSFGVRLNLDTIIEIGCTEGTLNELCNIVHKMQKLKAYEGKKFSTY